MMIMMTTWNVLVVLFQKCGKTTMHWRIIFGFGLDLNYGDLKSWLLVDIWDMLQVGFDSVPSNHR